MKLVGEDGEVETNKPDHSKEGGDLGEGRRGGGEEGRRGRIISYHNNIYNMILDCFPCCRKEGRERDRGRGMGWKEREEEREMEGENWREREEGRGREREE